MNNIYYVYMYLRKDGTPYYVGKGCKNRIYEKHNVSIPTDSHRIVFVQENMEERAALDLEVKLIAHYGRKDIGTGILRNVTDGGEGSSGYRHTPEAREKIREAGIRKTHTEESRQKISAKIKGRVSPTKGFKWSDESRAKLSKSATGRKHTQETKEKIRQINLGKKHGPETRKKVSEASKKRWETPGYRENFINKMTGKTHSEDTKELIRQQRLGVPRSEETKKKLSATLKEKWKDPVYRQDQLEKRKAKKAKK